MDRADDLTPIVPPLYVRESDDSLLRTVGLTMDTDHYSKWHADMIERRCPNKVSQEVWERRTEIIIAAEDRWRQLDIALDRLKFPEFERRYERADAAAKTLGVKILKVRARTIDGLIVKAKCAQWCNGGLEDEFDPTDFNDQNTMASLVLDLLAVSSLSPAAPAGAAVPPILEALEAA